jgi:4-coumarate--CoA ligase
MARDYKIVVKEGSGEIIYRANEEQDVPAVDFLTLLFGKSSSAFDSGCMNETLILYPTDHPSCRAKDSTVLHVSAANPSLRLTKADVLSNTRRLAYTLRHCYNIGTNGPSKNVVTVIATGHYYLPALFYGVIAAGGIFASVSTTTTAKEFAKLVKDANSHLVVCTEETKDVAMAAATTDSPATVLVIDPNGSGLRELRGEKVALEKEMEWERITDVKQLNESVVALVYSSGTTGPPKGVQFSHTNLVAQTVLQAETWSASIPSLYPDFSYRTLAHLPTAHIAGLSFYFLNAFYLGGTTYWMTKFDFPSFLRYNAEFRITTFMSVPPIFLQIAKSHLVTDQFATCISALSGGAPLGLDLQRSASAKMGFKNIGISQTWGMSEVTGSGTVLPVGQTDDTGSISVLLPNIEARFV